MIHASHWIASTTWHLLCYEVGLVAAIARGGGGWVR